jgi:hypothetical protein
LLRALLLQAFYTIRSETQLMEQLHYNLLYPWFVGLGVDEPVWMPTADANGRWKRRLRIRLVGAKRKAARSWTGHQTENCCMNHLCVCAGSAGG